MPATNLGTWKFDWHPLLHEMESYITRIRNGEQFNLGDSDLKNKYGAADEFVYHYLDNGNYMFRKVDQTLWCYGGQVMRAQIPITKELDKIFPNYTLSISKLHGHLGWHVDKSEGPCCGLNIQIHTCDAKTHMLKGGYYPSIDGSVNLLDNMRSHKIENNGVIRRWFHCKIAEPYEVALAKLKEAKLFGDQFVDWESRNSLSRKA